MLWLDWSQITPAWCLLDCTILETAKKCRHGSGVVPVVWRKLEGTFRFQVLTCYSPAFFQLFFFLLENNNKGNRTDFSDFQLVQIRQQAGISKETRLQNGGKICRDWSGFVTIWQSRCQSSQSIVQKSSFKIPFNYWHHTRSMPAIFLQFPIWCRWAGIKQAWSGFSLARASMPAWLHQNFKGNLKERLLGLKKDWKQGKSRSKSGSTKKFLQVSFKLLVWSTNVC